MSLKEKILILASKEFSGKWGRIILSDASPILGLSTEEITRTIEDEIAPEGEVKFHTDNIILIHRNLLPTKTSSPTTTITSSIDDETGKPDTKHLTDKEIEEYMKTIYPPTPYFPPRRTEAQIEDSIPIPTPAEYEIAQEDINHWAEEYEKKYPNKLIIDTILNWLRRKLPTITQKKRMEMAQVAIRYIQTIREWRE